MSDLTILSRWQFAITVGFHFVFVSISLGMVWLLFASEAFGFFKNSPDWKRLSKFFARLFIITFAFGAATGVVMEFQFGTNWARFSDFSGDVFGPPLAIETMTAFFLESIFIGLYIFGRGRVGPRVHLFSAFMVALGATISAFWIIVANSWMQTPAGFALDNGKVILTDFYASVFNPSTWPRFFHTVFGLMIAGSLFVSGIGAYFILRNIDKPVGLKAVKLGLAFGIICSILELFPFGHWSIMQVAHIQPEKFAAIEAIEKTQSHQRFVIFGIPTSNPPDINFKCFLCVPSLLSIATYGTSDAVIKGFDAFDPKDLPPVILTFTSFHLMVYLGLLFIAFTAWGTWLWHRGKLEESRYYLMAMLFFIPLPLVAIQLGWITAEVGRQPWIIYGVMRTADASSANVASATVGLSLSSIIILYSILGLVYTGIMTYLVKRGPDKE